MASEEGLKGSQRWPLLRARTRREPTHMTQPVSVRRKIHTSRRYRPRGYSKMVRSYFPAGLSRFFCYSSWFLEGLLKPRVHLEKGVSFCLPERKISPSCLVTDISFASKKDFLIAVACFQNRGRLRPPFKSAKEAEQSPKLFLSSFFAE